MKGDDSEIGARKHARKVKEVAEVSTGLTIAARLANNAKLQTVDIKMKDGAGDENIIFE